MSAPVEVIELASLGDLPELPRGEYYHLSSRQSYDEALEFLPEEYRGRVTECYHWVQIVKKREAHLWYFRVAKPDEVREEREERDGGKAV